MSRSKCLIMNDKYYNYETRWDNKMPMYLCVDYDVKFGMFITYYTPLVETNGLGYKYEQSGD